MTYPKLIVTSGIYYEKFPATEEGIKAAQEFLDMHSGKVFLVEEYPRKVSNGTTELTLTSRRVK
jgi:hypothetical protein